MAVARKTVGTPSTGTGTSKQPALPSDKAVGDLMVCFLSLKSNTTITKPADWNLIGDQVYSTTLGIHAYYKFYATNDVDPTFSWTGNAQSGAIVVSYTGVDRTTPIDVAWASNTFAAPSTPYDVSIPAVTTVSPRALVIGMIASVDDNSWAKQTAAFSAIWEGTTGNYDNAGSFAAADRAMATAGSAGTLVERETANQADAGAYAAFALRAITLISDAADTATIAEDKTVTVSQQTTLQSSTSSIAGIAESILLSLLCLVGVSDTGSIIEDVQAELVTPMPPLTIQVEDQVSAVDVLQELFEQARVEDSVEISLGVPVTLEVSVEEIAAIDESIEAGLSGGEVTLEVDVFDATGASDIAGAEVSAQTTLAINVSDIADIAEDKTINAEAALEVSVNDAVTAIDGFPFFGEIVSIGELVQVTVNAPEEGALQVSEAADAVGVTDGNVIASLVAAPPTRLISVTETVEVNEYYPGWRETVGVTESVNATLSAPVRLINVTDSAGISEASTVVRNLAISKSESVSITESRTVVVPLLTRFIAVSDSATVAEFTNASVSSQVTLEISVQDVAVAVDQVAADGTQPALLSSVTEICRITATPEVSTPLFFGQVFITDPVAVVEAVEVGALTPETYEISAEEIAGVDEATEVVSSAIEVPDAVETVEIIEDKTVEVAAQGVLEITVDETVGVVEDYVLTVAETLVIDVTDELALVDDGNVSIITPNYYVLAYIMKIA